MTYAIAIDDLGGMTFMGKRLSRDRIMLARLADLDGELLVLPYSMPLFAEGTVTQVSDPTVRREGAVLFLETVDPAPYLRSGDRLVVYRFGRRYPSTLACSVPFDRLTVLRETPFVGSSHPEMTETVYRIP